MEAINEQQKRILEGKVCLMLTPEQNEIIGIWGLNDFFISLEQALKLIEGRD